MKLLAGADNVGATIAEIRLGLPLRLLAAQRGWTLELRHLLDIDAAALAAADVLVLQRPVSRRALSLMRRMRASGGHVVCEIDDLLTEPAPHLQGHQRALALAPRVRRALAEADVVSAATARLADALRPLARRVVVVPNHAWPDAPQAAPWDLQGPLHLLLASSDQLAAGGLPQALQKLAELRPGRVRLVAVGPAALPLRAAGLAVDARPLLPRADFVAMAAALPQGVALIPLGHTRFDACKSAIKYFDYAAAGVPVLCSNLPPYADVVVDGRTGRLVADGAEAWLAVLLDLVDRPGQAQLWAQEAAREVAEKHSLAHAAAAWGELFDALGPRRMAAPASRGWRDALADSLRRLQKLNRARLARRAARRDPGKAGR